MSLNGGGEYQSRRTENRKASIAPKTNPFFNKKSKGKKLKLNPLTHLKPKIMFKESSYSIKKIENQIQFQTKVLWLFRRRKIQAPIFFGETTTPDLEMNFWEQTNDRRSECKWTIAGENVESSLFTKESERESQVLGARKFLFLGV